MFSLDEGSSVCPGLIHVELIPLLFPLRSVPAMSFLKPLQPVCRDASLLEIIDHSFIGKITSDGDRPDPQLFSDLLDGQALFSLLPYGSRKGCIVTAAGDQQLFHFLRCDMEFLRCLIHGRLSAHDLFPGVILRPMSPEPSSSSKTRPK